MPRQTEVVAYHLGAGRQVRPFTPVSLSFPICQMGIVMPVMTSGLGQGQQVVLLDFLLGTSGSPFVIRAGWDLVASRTFVCSDSLHLQPFLLPPVSVSPSRWSGYVTTDRRKAGPRTGQVSFLASPSFQWLV